MGLESGEFIPDLVETNPAGTDPISQGDDQIRLVKRCVQGSFGAFVGTEAVPASVTLTEDELNDAAQKAADAIITGLWRHNVTLALANDVALSCADSLDALQNAVRMLTSDILAFGNSVTPTVRVQALTSVDLRISNVVVCKAVTNALGSFLVEDIGGNERKAAFRNPGFRAENADTTLVQSDEGQIVRKTAGGASNYTVPTLEAGTCITIENSDVGDNINLIQDAGMTLVALLGGDRITGNFTMAHSSIIQLYWDTATVVKAWGNGIS